MNEESWAIAHRILIPAFGPLSIKNMFPGMVDIASQLVAKVGLGSDCVVHMVKADDTRQWHRFSNARVDVVSDFTRLTLDTIALCTFSHRFNSFYFETTAPFVTAMARSLKASGMKLRRLPGTGWLHREADKQYAEDIKLQHEIADGVSVSAIHSSFTDIPSLSKSAWIAARISVICWIPC
jgi:cytochrome P450/NADPH-cytochrome P450 reductase